jgi:hypothetical protein
MYVMCVVSRGAFDYKNMLSMNNIIFNLTVQHNSNLRQCYGSGLNSGHYLGCFYLILCVL